MSTRVQNAETLDGLLRGRISALVTDIRRAPGFSTFKQDLRAEKAALLAVRAGEIPDTSLAAVRATLARKAASLEQSLRRAESPAFKAQLRQELDEINALTKVL